MPIGIILTVHTALIAHTVRTVLTALTVRTIQVVSKGQVNPNPTTGIVSWAICIFEYDEKLEKIDWDSYCPICL